MKQNILYYDVMISLSPDAKPISEVHAQPKELFFHKMIELDLGAESGSNTLNPTIKWSDAFLSEADISKLDRASKRALQEIQDGLQEQFTDRLERLGLIEVSEFAENNFALKLRRTLGKVRRVFQDPVTQIEAEFKKIQQKVSSFSPWFTADGKSIEVKRNGKVTTIEPTGVLWRPVRKNTDTGGTISPKKIDALTKKKDESDALKHELIEIAQKIKDGELSMEDPDVVAKLTRLRRQYVMQSSHLEITQEGVNAELQVPRYITGLELGNGGTGKVYMVFDMEKEDFFVAKSVAITPGSPNMDFHLGLLSSEAKTIAAVNDTPGLEDYTPRIYDVFSPQEGELVLIMEYLPGFKDPVKQFDELGLHVLDMYSEEKRQLKRRFMKTYMTQSGLILDALRPVVIHNDVKPANFLADEEGNVKVIDYGVASTVGSQLFGTASYMSPDNFKKTTVEVKPNVEILNDCFALTATFFRLVVERTILNSNINHLEFFQIMNEMQTKSDKPHWVEVEQKLLDALEQLGLEPDEVVETIAVVKAGFGVAGTTFTWNSSEEFTQNLVKHF